MKTFVAVLRGPEHVFEFVNDAHREAFGDRNLLGRARADVFGELNDQGFADAPRRAFQTGQVVYMPGKAAQFSQMPHGLQTSRRLDISYEPMRSAAGEVTGLYVHGRDVTAIGAHPLEARATCGGLTSLTDAEILTLHLYHGTLDLDSAERADNLLKRFDGLAGVLAASMPSLMKLVPGHRLSTSSSVSGSAALHLKITAEIARRVMFGKMVSKPIIASSASLRAYLHDVLAAEPREKFLVLFLDRAHRLIACETLWEGTIDHAPVYAREVVRRAVELSASGMIVVHNHPSGLQEFSSSDLTTTQAIQTSARVLGIDLIDHLLVAGKEIVSMVESGLLTAASRRRAH